MARRGPGKFSTNLDAYAYELTTDGGADEEASYGEGNGWYGLIWINPSTRKSIQKIAADDVALDEDDDEVLNGSGAVILFERSDGIVEADWFDDQDKAEKAWAAILADTEGEEDDEDNEDDEDDEDDEEEEGDDEEEEEEEEEKP